MVKSILYIGLLGIGLSSCLSQELLTIKAYGLKYSIIIPNGSQLTKLRDDEGLKEYRATYPDGSVIYITDDTNGVQHEAKENKYGSNIYIELALKDTLELDGMDDLKYWSEKKMGKIVVGYFNVPQDKKLEYDKAVATLRNNK